MSVEPRWPIPRGWDWTSIATIAEVTGGGTPSANYPSNFSEDEGVPWITPADLTGYEGTYIARGRRNLSDRGYKSSSAKLLPAGAVLFTSRAPIGYCAIAANPIATNQGFKSLALFGGISGEFTRHYLKWSKPYLESLASGTTFLELSGSKLQEAPFPLPPLAEQKRIVARLDALNAKSARARTELARIETLVSRYKQAVLNKAFSGVDAERIALRDLTEFVTSGSRGWAKFYSDAGPLFIRIGNTVRGTIVPDFDDIQRVTPPEGAEGVRTRVQPDDIVVTITADVGRIALIDDKIGEAYVNQHLALMRLSSTDSAAFFAWYLVSDEGQAQLHRNNRGATRSGLGLDDIRQVELPIPSLEEQHEIVRRIETAFTKIDRLAAEAKRALELVGRLDEAILSKAFRGELVPQDENDEPAEHLLARIRAERQAAPKMRRGRRA